MFGVANEFVGFDDFRESVFPILKRNAAQIVSVEINEIEQIIDNLDVSAAGDAASVLADTRALLHEAERGPALLIECDEFAIEDRCFRLDELWQDFDLGKLTGEIIVIARNQPDL